MPLALYAWTRRRRGTYLVVLDREENETLRVLLEKRFIGFSLFDAGSHLVCLHKLLSELIDRRVDGLERRGRVLLAHRLKVELFDRGVGHLKIL